MEILVDGDACPVKDEVYRVARRYAVAVKVVSNRWLAVPADPLIERVVVAESFDAADDWIAARAGRESIVVTADVPLASRCVRAGAEVIAPDGRLFTPSSIGIALATRNLLDELRAGGAVTGGPKPFSPRDRSRFLQALDAAAVRLQRRRPQ